MKCIYALMNLITGKMYIGSTTNFYRRCQTHMRLLRQGIHHSLILQNSFNKHKEVNFKFIILEKLKKDEICHIREQYYLDKYESYDRKKGYNIAKSCIAPYGLNNIRKVYQYDLKGKLINIFKNCVDASNYYNLSSSGIASCCRGKYRYYDKHLWLYEDNINENNIKSRLKRANAPLKRSDEAKLKMSASAKNRKNKKAIIQMDTNGNFIKEWECTRDACKSLGFSNGHISDCLHGKHKQARGYIWKFKNEL